MKKKLLTFISIAGIGLIFLGCKEKKAVTTIQVNLENLSIDTIAYYVSQDGIGAYPLWGWEKASIGPDHSTEIKVENNGMNTMLIQQASATYSRTVSLFILPGETYNITLSAASNKPLSIEGPDAEAQLFMNDFDYRFLRKYQTGRGDFEQLYGDTVPETIMDHFELRIQPELSKLEALNKTKPITPERFEAIKDHLIYSYLKELLTILQRRASQTETMTLQNYQNVTSYPLDSNDPAFRDLVTSLFSSYPYNHKNFILNPDYNKLVYSWLWYKSLDDTLKITSIDNEVALAQKYLDPSLYEFYYATEFGRVSLKEPYSAVKKRFQEFKTLFPESKYLPGVKKLMPRLYEIYSRYAVEEQPGDSLQE